MGEEAKVKGIYRLLCQTDEAHRTFEQKVLNGRRDQEWSDWYAEYLIGHGLDNIVGNELAAELLSQFLLQTREECLTEETQFDWADFTAARMLEKLL